MNILYIGSYRMNDDVGEISRLYLQDIASKHNVTARPIFINKNIIKIVDPKIIELENNLFSEYDYCIQALPMEMLTFCGSIKKHIALISHNYLNAINNYSVINQLNRMDTVDVNNVKDESILVRSGISCEIKKIDCPINIDMANSIDKKFNFGIHSDHHKFYLFANYKEDIEIIQNAISAFYTAFRCREGHSLIMILEGSEQDKEHLNKTRSELKKQIGIPDEYNNSISELYIFDQLSDSDKIMMHNSCDTFLNLSPTASILQKEYALFFGNNIIDKNNTETIEFPHKSYYGNTIYYPGNFIESSTTNSISATMISCSAKYKKIPTTNTYNNKLSHIIS